MWFFVFNWLFFGKWNLKKESKRFFCQNQDVRLLSEVEVQDLRMYRIVIYEFFD